jgi:hypothetical protein
MEAIERNWSEIQALVEANTLNSVEAGPTIRPLPELAAAMGF